MRAAPLLIRRSRGYVPASLELPVRSERHLLGCGAELKSTFCLARGDRAWVGHHIGDLKNWETLRSFREGIEHFERLFAVRPALVAHDLHPDYLSTRYAQERAGVELEPVQHHHAHLAACLAEHRHQRAAVGAIFDGAGLGPDGTVWGGELLVGDLVGFERVGLLLPVRLPGGDAAVAEPWRMACSWLAAAAGGETPALPVALADPVAPEAWDSVAELVASGVGSPLTSSAGRLFDAVAAICGVQARVNYEGQAAAELEGASDPRERASYPMPLSDGEPTVLDPRPTLAAIRDEIAAGTEVGIVGAGFHNALAAATAEACSRAAEAHGLDAAVLSGGVFQNRLLLERTAAALRARGIEVLIPERLPPNDGGIAYGQVAVAAARDASRN
jgi:hydrogenase maturation protein HypF